MNKIDDIFKSGLDGKGINSSAEQWAEMNKLLDSGKGAGKQSSIKIIALVTVVLVAIIWAIWPNMENSSTFHQESISNTIGDSTSNSSLGNSPNANNETSYKEGNEPKQERNIDPYGAKQNSPTPPLTPAIYSGPDNAFKEQTVNPFDGQTHNQDDNDKADPTDDRENSYTHQNYDSFNFLELNLKPKQNYKFHSGITNANPEKKDHPPIRLKNTWKLYINPRMDLGFNNRNLSIANIEKLKSTESSMFKPNIGLDVLIKHNHLGFKMGLGLINLAEKTNYSVSYTDWTYDTSFVMIKREFTKAPNGKYAALLQTQIDSTGTGKERIDCENCIASFQYLSIPLAIQYEMHHRRMIYYFELGGSVWLFRSGKGRYVLFDESTNEESDLIGDLRNGIGLSSKLYQMNAGVGVKYRLSPKLNLTANYLYTHSFNSMTTNYQQSTRLHRLGFGMEFLLWEL